MLQKIALFLGLCIIIPLQLRAAVSAPVYESGYKSAAHYNVTVSTAGVKWTCPAGVIGIVTVSTPTSAVYVNFAESTATPSATSHMAYIAGGGSAFLQWEVKPTDIMRITGAAASRANIVIQRKKSAGEQ